MMTIKYFTFVTLTSLLLLISTQSYASFVDEVLRLVNVERAKIGLNSLCLSKQLTQAAQVHSNDMATNDFLSHTGSDNSKFSDRVKLTGYKYSMLGENVASGQSTPELVIDSWMNSSGHRANILNPEFTELGVGYALNDNTLRKHYWTQVFGAPVDTPTCTTSNNNPTTGKLSGISTRCLVGVRAEDYMYAGFNISGGTKKVTVGAYTVTQIPGNNFLPRLEIKTFPEGKSVYVDNNQNLVHSVANTLDLAEGWYTVTVSPIAQAGIGIVYVNEVDANSALLSSISTRCYVGTKEEDSMIAGISVAGNSQCVEMLGLGITQIPGNTFLPMLNVQTFPDNKHFNAAKSIYADVNTKHEARISKLQQLEVGPYTSMVTPVQAAGIGQVAVSTKTTCN